MGGQFMEQYARWYGVRKNAYNTSVGECIGVPFEPWMSEDELRGELQHTMGQFEIGY